MNQATPVIRPYLPPRIASASLDALNALARHGGELVWTDADGAGACWRFSIDLAQARAVAAVPVLTQVAAAGGAKGGEEDIAADGRVALRLWTSGANLRLLVPRAALAAWLAAALPGVGRFYPDGWVMDAAVDCLLDFLRARLRALDTPAGWQLDRDSIHVGASFVADGCGAAHLATPDTGEPGAQVPWIDAGETWPLILRADTGETWPLILQADAGGLSMLARCVARRDAVGQDISLDDVPIPLRAMVGYTDLTHGDLRRLLPGDVVMLDRTLGGGNGDVCLLAPDGRALRLAAAARHRADGRPDLPAPYLIVADWISMMSPEEKENYPEDDDALDFDMSDIDEDDEPWPQADAVREGDADDAMALADSTDPADPAYPSDGVDAEALDAIPVRLGFDLGARGMALGELRRLRPGQTLVLDCEVAAAPVAIRANGRCIAHGELVDIDGRLGVRIVDLRRQRT